MMPYNKKLEESPSVDKLLNTIVSRELPQENSIIFLEKGQDSLVYKVDTSNGIFVLKLYHYYQDTDQDAREKFDIVRSYSDLTNSVSQYLSIFPYINLLEINGQNWTIEFQVTPILRIGSVDNIPYAISAFVPGEDMYDIDKRAIGKSRTDEVMLPSVDGDIVNFDGQIFWEIHNYLGLGVNCGSTRIRLDDFKDFVEQDLLGTEGISLEAGNIKACVDPNNKKIVFIVTDIGGKVTDINCVNGITAFLKDQLLRLSG